MPRTFGVFCFAPQQIICVKMYLCYNQQNADRLLKRNDTKKEAYKEIAGLVERFSEQYDSYKKADYNETLTRRDFIDPFFKALGWDIDNKNGYAESYREVIHE